MRLYGPYRRLFGVGRLRLDRSTAYGEPFDSAAADLRFEGTGVRLNGLDIRKGRGPGDGGRGHRVGRASYSFDGDARGVDVASLTFRARAAAPAIRGTTAGTASGVGLLDDPRYTIRATVSNLRIEDEEVGHITGRLDVRDGDLRLNLEGASSTVAFSAAVRVTLSGRRTQTSRYEVADWSLDPYVRMLVPEWSLYAGGAQRLAGRRRSVARLGPPQRDHPADEREPARLRDPQRRSDTAEPRPAGFIGIDRQLKAVGVGIGQSATINLASAFTGPDRPTRSSTTRRRATHPSPRCPRATAS